MKEYSRSVTTFMKSSVKSPMQSTSFANGYCVERAATRDRHSVLRASQGAQEQDGLGRYVRGGHVERHEHDLRRAISVRLGFREASVRETRCSSGVIFFMSVQFVTMPCSMDAAQGAANEFSHVADLKGSHQCSAT